MMAILSVVMVAQTNVLLRKVGPVAEIRHTAIQSARRSAVMDLILANTSAMMATPPMVMVALLSAKLSLVLVVLTMPTRNQFAILSVAITSSGAKRFAMTAISSAEMVVQTSALLRKAGPVTTMQATVFAQRFAVMASTLAHMSAMTATPRTEMDALQPVKLRQAGNVLVAHQLRRIPALLSSRLAPWLNVRHLRTNSSAPANISIASHLSRFLIRLSHAPKLELAASIKTCSLALELASKFLLSRLALTRDSFA